MASQDASPFQSLKIQRNLLAKTPKKNANKKILINEDGGVITAVAFSSEICITKRRKVEQLNFRSVFRVFREINSRHNR